MSSGVLVGVRGMSLVIGGGSVVMVGVPPLEFFAAAPAMGAVFAIVL